MECAVSNHAMRTESMPVQTASSSCRQRGGNSSDESKHRIIRASRHLSSNDSLSLPATSSSGAKKGAALQNPLFNQGIPRPFATAKFH